MEGTQQIFLTSSFVSLSVQASKQIGVSFEAGALRSFFSSLAKSGKRDSKHRIKHFNTSALHWDTGVSLPTCLFFFPFSDLALTQIFTQT
jgi:hypothetical protein